MPRFIWKKPIVEAIQWPSDGIITTQIIAWLEHRGYYWHSTEATHQRLVSIVVKEGAEEDIQYEVEPGDWIVVDADNFFFTCDEDKFDEDFEQIEEDGPLTLNDFLRETLGEEDAKLFTDD